MSTFSVFNASDLNLFEHRVSKPYWEEMQLRGDFSVFSGNSPNQIIFKKYQPSHEGDTVTIGLERTYFPNVQFGGDVQLSGTGEKLVFVNESIKVDRSAIVNALTDREMDEIRVNINLDPIMRSNIYRKGKLVEKCKIMNQFGLAFVGTGRLPDYQFYRYDQWDTQLLPKMLECTIDNPAAGSTISTDRVVFGADRQAQATVNASIADAILADPDLDTLNIDHLRTLQELATKGGRSITGDNDPIVPYETSPAISRTSGRDEGYVLLTSSRLFRRLEATDAWQRQATRGVIEDRYRQPSLLHNFVYKGSLAGVQVFVYPEWDKYVFTNDGNHLVGYSAFLGQAAIGHVIGRTPWSTFELRNHELSREIALHTIDGMRVIKFPKKDPVLRNDNPIKVEKGLIHSFTRIT